jgi:hypothetical protein
LIADGVFSPSHRRTMEPITIAAIVGGAAAVAGAGATVYSSNKQAKAAENASDDQAAEQARLRNELVTKQQQEEASTAAKAARDRQRMIGSKLGRSSTVLTSPLGLPGPGYTIGGGKAGAA